MNETDLRDLEGSLQRMLPAPPVWERDRFFFTMGQASARGRRRWPPGTAVSALLAACLAFVLLARVLQPTPVRIVRVPVPTAPVERESPREVSPLGGEPTPFVRYLRLRDEVLRQGLDGLPELPEPSGELPTLPEARLYPF